MQQETFNIYLLYFCFNYNNLSQKMHNKSFEMFLIYLSRLHKQIIKIEIYVN